MYISKLDKLKEKLKIQINNNDSYEMIYKTSIEIDKLLIKYYNAKKDLNY